MNRDWTIPDYTFAGQTHMEICVFIASILSFELKKEVKPSEITRMWKHYLKTFSSRRQMLDSFNKIGVSDKLWEKIEIMYPDLFEKSARTISVGAGDEFFKNAEIFCDNFGLYLEHQHSVQSAMRRHVWIDGSKGIATEKFSLQMLSNIFASEPLRKKYLEIYKVIEEKTGVTCNLNGFTRYSTEVHNLYLKNKPLPLSMNKQELLILL